MDWKKIIVEILEYQKINQTELAKKVGVDKSYIAQIKLGWRGEPKYTIATKLLELHPTGGVKDHD